MKFKTSFVLLILSLSISLSACSANKTDTATNSGNDAGGKRLTVNSTAPPADEAFSPVPAYKAVLQNQADFISTEDSQSYYLNDFLNMNSEYAGAYTATHFTQLDMDGDQTPEVILELSRNDYPDQYEILHYSNGTVYGYNFVYRGMEMLKSDGTYTYANGAADVGVQKILSFNTDSVKTESLGYSQSDFSGNNNDISYFIQDTSVTKESFDTFSDQQNEKEDAQWYEFSSENIETKLV